MIAERDAQRSSSAPTKWAASRSALASAAAWLRAAGWDVDCVDAAKEQLADERARRRPISIGFHLPMHTATRLAAPIIAARARG